MQKMFAWAILKGDNQDRSGSTLDQYYNIFVEGQHILAEGLVVREASTCTYITFQRMNKTRQEQRASDNDKHKQARLNTQQQANTRHNTPQRNSAASAHTTHMIHTNTPTLLHHKPKHLSFTPSFVANLYLRHLPC